MGQGTAGAGSAARVRPDGESRRLKVAGRAICTNSNPTGSAPDFYHETDFEREQLMDEHLPGPIARTLFKDEFAPVAQHIAAKRVAMYFWHLPREQARIRFLRHLHASGLVYFDFEWIPVAVAW